MEENDNTSNLKSIKDNDENIVNGIGFIKKIIFIILGLIFLAITALFIFEKTVNFSKMKTKFNSEMQNAISEVSIDNKYQSSVIINGNIKYYSFIFPHFDIDNVEVKNIMEDNYYYNFEIKKIRIFISLSKFLVNKKIEIIKIEIIDGDFTIKEINLFEYSLGKKLYDIILKKALSDNKDLNISFKNCNLVIDKKNYKREFSNINLKTFHNSNKLNIIGKMLSNRQPLNVDLLMDIKNNIFDGKIALQSQSFKIDSKLKFNYENLNTEGSLNFDIVNFQLFSRTIFDPSNFLYKRVIDNSSLKASLNFSLSSNLFQIKNINLNGKNINGKGDIEFNSNKNQKNSVTFDIDSMNLDGLIIKDLISKNKLSEKDITLFSGEESKKEEKKEELNGFFDKIIKTNSTFFDIKIKSLNLNQYNIFNTSFIFSYFGNDNIMVENISSTLPGETILNIDNKNGYNFLKLNGKNFDKFWNFLKNSSVSSKLEKEKEFELNGTLVFKNNKVLLMNSEFNFDDIKSKNEIEIFLDSGISLLAINSKVENLNLNNLLSKVETSGTSNTSFKNQILFLNEFDISTLINLNINNLIYNNLTYKDYNLIIKTSRGKLDVYNINLNNKIIGNININILNLNPTIEINLNFNNLIIDEEIDFNKFIFNIPTLDDIYGNLNITFSNSLFKKSLVNNIELNSKIINGIFNLNNFKIDGFGGKCLIQGFLDLKYNRKLNLTFNGCTADLKDTLYLFTNTNNITGLIGFSSVLYTEGQNLENFVSNYVLKLNLIGSGIIIDEFGLFNLSSDLFKISNDLNFAKVLSPDEVIYSKENKTIFEKLSGSVDFSKKNKGQVNLDISRELINGKINGTFDLLSNSKASLNMFANFIMLSGTLQKTIPLTLLIQITGNTPDKLLFNTNFRQINDFINSVVISLEEKKLNL